MTAPAGSVVDPTRDRPDRLAQAAFAAEAGAARERQ